jgi:hypothetical protein
MTTTTTGSGQASILAASFSEARRQHRLLDEAVPTDLLV